jgi:hypothetical protein
MVSDVGNEGVARARHSEDRGRQKTSARLTRAPQTIETQGLEKDTLLAGV